MLGIGMGIGNFEAYVSVQYIGKFPYQYTSTNQSGHYNIIK